MMRCKKEDVIKLVVYHLNKLVNDAVVQDQSILLRNEGFVFQFFENSAAYQSTFERHINYILVTYKKDMSGIMKHYSEKLGGNVCFLDYGSLSFKTMDVVIFHIISTITNVCGIQVPRWDFIDSKKALAEIKQGIGFLV